jgi:ribosome biogenesis protein MAK21
MKATMPRVEGDEDLLEDPLEGPEDSDGFDFSSEMSDPSEGDEDEEQGNTFEENAENLSDGGGSDHLSLVEASDAEDLINLNDEVDVGIINAHFSDSESEDGEEWGGVREPQAKSKRKRGAADNGHTDIKGKKRKLRSLPTFASYDDYAAMIDDGPEDDI